ENWSMAYKLSQRAAGDFCEISDFRWREFGEAGQTADRMRRKLCLRRWVIYQAKCLKSGLTYRGTAV
ncbi:hypothetical protein AADM20_17185, partial [Erwinia amylovora]|uniref:hypothetical protein n=1 Tax=Erwinia amylovora TaxID=552 RepID=UPI0037DCF0A1